MSDHVCAECGEPSYAPDEIPDPHRLRTYCGLCRNDRKRRSNRRSRTGVYRRVDAGGRESRAELGLPPLDHGQERQCPCGARLSRWNPGPDCHACERAAGVLRTVGDRFAAAVARFCAPSLLDGVA